MSAAAARLLLLVLALAGCGSEQDATPLPAIGTEVGSRAPSLEGQRPGGEAFALSPGGSEATLLVFYRGAYCGLCRERLRRLQAHLPAYDELDARVIAVTQDDTAVVRSTVERLGLQFPVVSVDTAALARWDVLDPESRTPRPTAILLDADGVIRFRHGGRNAADRASDVAILTLLQRARREDTLQNFDIEEPRR